MEWIICDYSDDEILKMFINYTVIEKVRAFNFRHLIINESLEWNSLYSNIASNISHTLC